MDLVKATKVIFLVTTCILYVKPQAFVRNQGIQQLPDDEGKSNNLRLHHTQDSINRAPSGMDNSNPIDAAVQKLLQRGDKLALFKEREKKTRRKSSRRMNKKKYRKWRKNRRKFFRRRNRRLQFRSGRKISNVRNTFSNGSNADSSKPGNFRNVRADSIINGKIVKDLSAVPYQAGIWVRRGGGLRHHCGGTIISRYLILTAAHCFRNSFDVQDYIIRVGDLDITVKERYEQSFRVWETFIHPSFRENKLGGYDYDIAIVLIQPNSGSYIEFSRKVRGAYLPNRHTRIIPRKRCHSTGWGRISTDWTGPFSKKLRIVRTDVLDMSGQRTCDKNYEGEITKRMLCAGYLDGTEIDTCAGDSGGPLVCEINGMDVVVGIISWGTMDCAVSGYPGVYTNVQALLGWLESFIL